MNIGRIEFRIEEMVKQRNHINLEIAKSLQELGDAYLDKMGIIKGVTRVSSGGKVYVVHSAYTTERGDYRNGKWLNGRLIKKNGDVGCGVTTLFEWELI